MFVQELAMILGLTPQQIVTMIRADNGAIGGGRSVALEIVEGVMGRVVWEHYSNSKFKEMTGARKPGWLASHREEEQRSKRRARRFHEGIDTTNST